MSAHFVPHFLPSRRGFHFPNRFPTAPLFHLQIPGIGRIPIGDASRGMCGGMVFGICDHFRAELEPLPLTSPPTPDHPLYPCLMHRLFGSFDLPFGPLKYHWWMILPDAEVLRRTVRIEWPRVRASLDRCRLTPLGLVRVRSRNPLRMGENHQVLAYGYQSHEDHVEIAVYDPNHPNDDEVRIALQRNQLSYSTGEPLRGFFFNRYQPEDGSIRGSLFSWF